MSLSLGVVACAAIAGSFLTFSLGYAVYVMLAGIGGFIFVTWLFRHFIHAQCPDCGQPARLEMSRTYKYRCTSCGYVHETGISSSPD